MFKNLPQKRTGFSVAFGRSMEAKYQTSQPVLCYAPGDVARESSDGRGYGFAKWIPTPKIQRSFRLFDFRVEMHPQYVHWLLCRGRLTRNGVQCNIIRVLCSKLPYSTLWNGFRSCDPEHCRNVCQIHIKWLSYIVRNLVRLSFIHWASATVSMVWNKIIWFTYYHCRTWLS